MKYALLTAFTLIGVAGSAQAQGLPRIQALYPPGARQGTTVEVAIRGGGMEGAKEVLVKGDGLSATLNSIDVKIDAAEQRVFSAKCALCHELRGPASMTRTAEQWTQTVDRMIRDRQAPIEQAERAKIVSYLSAAARASAGLTAKITVAPNAAPGRREIRVVGFNGTSTGFPFEVTAQPESIELEPNDKLEAPQAVTLPLTVSGQVGSGDVDRYRFEAKKGQRLVFNCNAYRLNESSQVFFMPVLYLYDEKGKELAKNTGYFSFDPLIDWTAPADGSYTVLIRDMLYRGSPASIYRLSMGSLPYRAALYPAGGRRGETVQAALMGENMAPATVPIPLAADAALGSRQVVTGHGAFPFMVGEFPEHVEKSDANPSAAPTAIALPASLNGRLVTADETDRYAFSITKENAGAYSFEVFADRVGSPVLAQLTLRDAQGRALNTVAAGTNGRDPRLDVTLSRPGDYTLEINDLDGKSGPSDLYRITAGPALPDFEATIGPDNPSLGPGGSIFLPVQIRRRVGVTSDIEVTLNNLPTGITASKAVIRPDQNQGFVILTAAPDAKLGSYTLTRPVAKAVVSGQTVEREIQPLEIYLINNNRMIRPAGNMVVSVGPEPAWTVTLSVKEPRLGMDTGPLEVTVRFNRKGEGRDMPFAIVGTPSGVQAPGSILFRKGSNETTFTLRPSNQGIFARAAQDGPQQFQIAVITGREGEGIQLASTPLVITASAPAPAK